MKFFLSTLFLSALAFTRSANAFVKGVNQVLPFTLSHYNAFTEILLYEAMG